MSKKTVTKRELVNTISKKTEFTQTQVLSIMQLAFDTITSILAKGDTVVVRNFGIFEVREVKAKVGRNPKNPSKDVIIPARSVVKFKVGKELKQKVGKLKSKKK